MGSRFMRPPGSVLHGELLPVSVVETLVRFEFSDGAPHGIHAVTVHSTPSVAIAPAG